MQQSKAVSLKSKSNVQGVRLQALPGDVFEFGKFTVSRVVDAVIRSRMAVIATKRAVWETCCGRQRQRRVGYRAALKSAFTYLVIAAFWEMFEHEFDPLALGSAFFLGAFIGPGLAPWLRLFPVTGDPTYSGLYRGVDLIINLGFHLLSSAIFVFCFKFCVAGAAIPVIGELIVPAFFKGSTGLIIANYLRKFGTEVLGVKVLLPSHPLGPELVSQQIKAPGESVDHLYLRAWNELRELPGPGCLGLAISGWGNPPRGYRSLIDESKMLDPALAGLLDHFLR